MKKNMKKNWASITFGVAVLIVILALGVATTYTSIQVDGESMSPTLKDNQKIYVNVKAYDNEEPKIGDVVAMNDAEEENGVIVKRVLGVAGDIIEFRNKVMYRNGEALTDIVLPDDYEDFQAVEEAVTVEAGEVYLLGDNISNSSDSRVKGTFSSENLAGQILFN